MAMIKAITAEMEGATEFFSKRTGTSTDDQGLRKSFAESVIKMITGLKNLSKTEAASLLGFDDTYGEHWLRVEKCIETKLKGQDKCLTDDTTNQSMQLPWKYYTAEDWDVFRDQTKPWMVKVCRAVERPMLAGALHLDEQSLGRILGLLVSTHYDEIPPARSLYAKLQELKTAVSTERKSYPFVQLKEFPDDPNELPEDIFAFAYAEGAPVDVELHGINVIVDRIPLRSNSKLLNDEPKMTVKVKKEFEALKKATEGDADAEGIVVSYNAAGSMVTKDSLKKFKQARSDAALDFDDLPQDADEKALYCQYKMDLWKLRCSKIKSDSMGSGVKPTKSEQVDVPSEPSDGSMRFRSEADGSLAIFPREFDVPEAALTSAGEGDSVKPVKLAGTKAQKQQPTAEDDLDDVSKAALLAFQNRNVKKKDEAKAKAKAKAAAKAGVVKKPAANAETVVQYEGRDKPKAPIMPKDGSNPPPTSFKQGCLYVSRKVSRVRALRVKTDMYSEVSRAYGEKRPFKQAWAECVDAIACYKVAKTESATKAVGKKAK
jgi:hypothetical protein